jgi:hypothetical protein
VDVLAGRVVAILALVVSWSVVAPAPAAPAAQDPVRTFYEQDADGDPVRVFGVSPADAVQMMACDTAEVGVDAGDHGVAFVRNWFTWSVQGRELPRALRFGRVGDEAFCADWDGDGVDNAVVRRGNVIHFGPDLRSSLPVVVVQAFGRADDDLLLGDWDGDGIETPAVRRGREFHFSNVHPWAGPAREVWRATFGLATDLPTEADWDGDGVDTLGVLREGTWHLTNADEMETRVTHATTQFGVAGDEPVPGDWDNDGTVELGFVRVQPEP